ASHLSAPFPTRRSSDLAGAAPWSANTASSLAKTRFAPKRPSDSAAAEAPGPSATAATSSESDRAFVNSSNTLGCVPSAETGAYRSEEHTSELQSPDHLV